ncbi:MAG: 16S rRNA (cytosine(1402)-N(4))-methyltransferase RsmH [Schleiferilactobacillus perolens]|jgi:16S rRNA (cytosine1402-N4)-methyltransferase|uniref:Ribosomal RNA small subunit methyltransferase H n=2 Tax=Schleiferilactobacillus perolens TaxID=100468 RepID=A0A0R1NBG2_9LACO|nr:16S rRNA (cytosine(1402)-N(4))-methyltransferase RsmH [Schleiferilactobacillus perolens]KRL14219.1 S-adenosyl-methyltransferase [Schleiferilactobacillus perolens DSM 12744]
MSVVYEHHTVLRQEAVTGLAIEAGGTYVDATFGRGGHTQLLLETLAHSGQVIAFDADEAAIAAGHKRFAQEIENDRLVLVHDNFRHIATDIPTITAAPIRGVLYDLGVSSPQFDDPTRGFSYRFDSPLDMRMDQTQPLTAQKIVNEWSQQDLARTIRRYGEERFAGSIAKRIVLARGVHPIETTGQLADLVKEAIPAAARRTGGNPAKRTFQAIRIAVNDELGALQDSLEEAITVLAAGGRLSVITFQSLEDRIVKKVMQVHATSKQPADLPVLGPPPDVDMKLITRKPIRPSAEELAANHRAHSARLRIAEKL